MPAAWNPSRRADADFAISHKRKTPRLARGFLLSDEEPGRSPAGSYCSISSAGAVSAGAASASSAGSGSAGGWCGRCGLVVDDRRRVAVRCGGGSSTAGSAGARGLRASSESQLHAMIAAMITTARDMAITSCCCRRCGMTTVVVRGPASGIGGLQPGVRRMNRVGNRAWVRSQDGGRPGRPVSYRRPMGTLSSILGLLKPTTQRHGCESSLEGNFGCRKGDGPQGWRTVPAWPQERLGPWGEKKNPPRSRPARSRRDQALLARAACRAPTAMNAAGHFRRNLLRGFGHCAVAGVDHGLARRRRSPTGRSSPEAATARVERPEHPDGARLG